MSNIFDKRIEREREEVPSSVENALMTNVKVDGKRNGWSCEIANKSCHRNEEVFSIKIHIVTTRVNGLSIHQYLSNSCQSLLLIWGLA